MCEQSCYHSSTLGLMFYLVSVGNELLVKQMCKHKTRIKTVSFPSDYSLVFCKLQHQSKLRSFRHLCSTRHGNKEWTLHKHGQCEVDLIGSDIYFLDSSACFLAFRRSCVQRETTWPTLSDTRREERMRRQYLLASTLDLLIHHRYQTVFLKAN